MGPLTVREVRVQNYCNIQDSGWVPFERVTNLVGRNESGKTAFLKALHKFKAANGETYDPQRDFPRDRYTRDFRAESAAEWSVCSVRFEVAKEYAEELKKAHGVGVLIKTVECTKDYSNQYSWETTPDFSDDPVPASELITALDKFQRASRRLDSKVAEQREQDQQERQKLVAAGTTLSDATGKLTTLKGDAGVKLLTQVRDQINALSTPLSAAVVEEFVDNAKKLLARAQAPSKRDAVLKALFDKIPVFIYFEDYGVLDSAIYLPEFLDQQKRTPHDPKVRTIAAMFQHVNLSATEISALGEEKVTAARAAKQPVSSEMIEQEEKQKEARAIKLNSASIDITRRFQEWWKQRRHKIATTRTANISAFGSLMIVGLTWRSNLNPAARDFSGSSPSTWSSSWNLRTAARTRSSCSMSQACIYIRPRSRS